MSAANGTGINSYENPAAVPFNNAEEAWFWFIAAQEACQEGARLPGPSLTPRPCEPVDILQVLDRLRRHRRLLTDHLLVLRHYGRRYMAPDPGRIKEARAFMLWHEALERIGAVLAAKNIIRQRRVPGDGPMGRAGPADPRRTGLSAAAE